MKQDHPWQVSPAELISYALKHLDSDSEFDRRIAFLLIDVGIETILKIYLQLPERIVGSKVPFGKRKAATEGTFHDLINMISKVSPEKLEGINLDHIEFYHGRRNLLYHQGFGISINADNVLNYAKLSTLLLKNLLSVDLTAKVIIKAPDETKRKQGQLINSINEIKSNLRSEIKNLFVYTSNFINKIKPEFATLNFVHNFPISIELPPPKKFIDLGLTFPPANKEEVNYFYGLLPIELKEYILENPKDKEYIVNIAFHNYKYFMADFLILSVDYMPFNITEIHPSHIISSTEEFINSHHPWRVFDYKNLARNELEAIIKAGKVLIVNLRNMNKNLQKKWEEGTF